MKNKKWIKIFMVFSFISLFLVGITNYVIDPFQQYRKATLYSFWYGGIQNERFHIAGLAKNYKYESVVIGSSMTENFLISDVKRLISNPIKFCMSGARANEIHIVLETAYQYKKINNIILGLDIYALTGDVNQKRKNTNFPLYLYDKNPINDLNYILSFDTLRDSWNAVIKKNSGIGKLLYHYEHMYEWQYLANNNFGKKKVLDIWKNRKSSFNLEEWQISKLKKSFKYNVLSIIEAHPETKFYIFYPPYSALSYYEWKEQGVLSNVIKIKKHIYKKLSKYSNVKLYDFQVAKNIVLNLDNYKDSQHYHQKINSWIIDQMINNKFLVQKNNIDDYINVLKQESKEAVNAFQ